MTPAECWWNVRLEAASAASRRASRAGCCRSDETEGENGKAGDAHHSNTSPR
jgi:hypothetical protein